MHLFNMLNVLQPSRDAFVATKANGGKQKDLVVNVLLVYPGYERALTSWTNDSTMQQVPKPGQIL
jgi:hypothetical protein